MERVRVTPKRQTCQETGMSCAGTFDEFLSRRTEWLYKWNYCAMSLNFEVYYRTRVFKLSTKSLPLLLPNIYTSIGYWSINKSHSLYTGYLLSVIRGTLESQTTQLLYPLTLSRDQPHPVFSRASRLQYHNSPSLTSLCPSCLCIFIFISPFFRFYAFLSFTAPTDLNRIIVGAPGAEQTDIPPLCSDRQREGKKTERNERKEGLCVSVIPLLLLLGKWNSITFSWHTDKCFSVNEKTLLGANGAWKKQHRC